MTTDAIEVGDGSPDPWLWFAFLLPAAAVLFSLMQTEDLAYQVRAGVLMWQEHEILRVDPFTFTVAGLPWHDQQWGAQLIFAGIHGLAGWGALLIVRAAIVGGAVGATYVRTKRRGAPPMGAAIATFVPFIVCISLPGTLAMRPQLLAVPLFVLATFVLSDRRGRPRATWVLPLVGIAWANLHGSFVLLPLLCAVALVADVVDRAEGTWPMVGILALTLLAPAATPWGLRSYVYVYELSTAPVVRQVIDEWRPVLLQWPAGALFLVACLAIGAVCIRGDRSRLRTEDWITIAVFTALAIAGGRNLLWWSLAVPPAVGAALGAMPPSVWSLAAMRFVRISLVALVAVGLFRVVRLDAEQMLADAPAGITAAVGAEVAPDTRVFAGWWGSWFEYALPQALEFVDSRAELFPSATWDAYFAISRADPGWDSLLDQQGVDVVVASRQHQAALIEAMEHDQSWQAVYADASGVVFARSKGVSP